MRQDNAYISSKPLSRLSAIGKVWRSLRLQESLRSARRAAQVPPLGVQLAQCEQFVTRAQKRLVALDEERVKFVCELEGQERPQRLRVETVQRPRWRQCLHQFGQRSINDCSHL